MEFIKNSSPQDITCGLLFLFLIVKLSLYMLVNNVYIAIKPR